MAYDDTSGQVNPTSYTYTTSFIDIGTRDLVDFEECGGGGLASGEAMHARRESFPPPPQGAAATIRR